MRDPDQLQTGRYTGTLLYSSSVYIHAVGYDTASSAGRDRISTALQHAFGAIVDTGTRTWYSVLMGNKYVCCIICIYLCVNTTFRLTDVIFEDCCI